MRFYDNLKVNMKCMYCSEEISELKTTVLGNGYQTFRIGEIMIGSPIETGTLKRGAEYYCPHFEKSFYLDLKMKNYALIGIGEPITEQQYEKERNQLAAKAKSIKKKVQNEPARVYP